MFMRDLRRKIRGLLGTPTPVRPGHRYTDKITGERFDVISVGKKTNVKRLDADRRPENDVKTSIFRRAIDRDFIEHDPNKCPECDS